MVDSLVASVYLFLKFMQCLDFLGVPLKKGDWVIRAEKYGRTQHLVYSHIEEDPKDNNPQNFSFRNKWIIPIVTYDKFRKTFGKVGKAERNDCMVCLYESAVPKEVVEAYEKEGPQQLREGLFPLNYNRFNTTGIRRK